MTNPSCLLLKVTYAKESTKSNPQISLATILFEKQFLDDSIRIKSSKGTYRYTNFHEKSIPTAYNPLINQFTKLQWKFQTKKILDRTNQGLLFSVGMQKCNA